jgi:hypothetical protein
LSRPVSELLYTDFDGRPVTDPDDVIWDGLDDLRHRDRVPGLRALLVAPGTEPFDRFLACCALASWGEPEGYAAIAQAAAQSTEVPWYGAVIHHLTSADETFGHLAAAVVASEEIASQKGTTEERLCAQRALGSPARVAREDTVITSALLVLYEDEYFTGEMVDVEDGRLTGVTGYRGGMEHGPQWEWFPDGRLQLTGRCDGGIAVGEWREWHENGQLAEHTVFDERGDVRLRRRWDERGDQCT